MELLILGIDGGDQKIIEGMDMPFLQSLIRGNTNVDLTEDLYSRGWVEMLTGTQAEDSRCMYMSPVLDGTHGFEFSYGMKDMVGKDYLTPLWDLVNNHGKKIGIMNVPTTSPVCKLDGFMVAGGGGGLNKVEGIPPELVYPPEASKILEETGYTFDLRLTSSDVRTTEELMDRLDLIVKQRADAYLKLVDKFPVDIGFLCFRVTTGIQYLARPEIEAVLAHREMPEISGSSSSDDPALTGFHKRIVEHYRLLDSQIQRVFEAVEPQNFILTSDHGASRYLYRGNVDAFLEEKGYLVRGTDGFTVKKFIRGFLSKYVPYTLLKKYKSKAPASIKRLVTRFDSNKTKAFGYYYLKGIFINDTRRFSGPVEEGESLDQLVDEICVEINEDPRAVEIGLHAKPFRRDRMGKRFSDYLPDVIFEGPDEVFFEGKGPFIERNKDYSPLGDSLVGLQSDMRSGQKARHPLFVTNGAISSLVKDEDCRDLRLVYRAVEALIDNKI